MNELFRRPNQTIQINIRVYILFLLLLLFLLLVYLFKLNITVNITSSTGRKEPVLKLSIKSWEIVVFSQINTEMFGNKVCEIIKHNFFNPVWKFNYNLSFSLVKTVTKVYKEPLLKTISIRNFLQDRCISIWILVVKSVCSKNNISLLNIAQQSSISQSHFIILRTRFISSNSKQYITILSCFNIVPFGPTPSGIFSSSSKLQRKVFLMAFLQTIILLNLNNIFIIC